VGRVAAALRALTGRGPRESALLRAPIAEPVAEPVAPPVSFTGEEAAARIDAARERLRARIAPLVEDDAPAPDNEKRGP